MFKCKTVQQAKILQYIEANFQMDCIQIEIVDNYTLKVIDHKGDSIKFGYSWGKVIVRD